MADLDSASARSHVYQLLAGAFAFPTEQLYALIADGAYAAALVEAIDSLPYALPAGEALAGLTAEGAAYEAFQSEYIANFEVGMAGPPCPLYGGLYMGGRTAVWEELIRFYNHFGVHLSEKNRDLPDHLATELEFLHYLTFREAEAGDGPVVGTLRRAQRDFLDRHPARWVGKLVERIEKKGVLGFYQALIGLVDVVVREDLSYLSELLKGEMGQSALARGTRR